MSSLLRSRRALAMFGTVSLTLVSAATAMPPFGSWSAPANLETLPGSSSNLNTPAVDGCASLSRDALTLVFNSNRTGNFDLYVATRQSKSEGFGEPVRLPSTINTGANEACATFGPGNTLYFTSDRGDPAYDLYVSKRGPNGWSAPQNLGPNINVPGWEEEVPTFYEDSAGHEVMIYSRRRPSGPDGVILQSIDGAPATPVAGGPNSSASDNRPSITRDGLTLFYDSDRYGTLGGPDLYYSTRSSTNEPFGPAIHLESLSSPAFDARPYISFDGTMLIFSSSRPGSTSPAPDMWFTTRSKAVGH